MNPYFLEYLISSTSIILVLIIGGLIILLVNLNIRMRNIDNQYSDENKKVNILLKVFSDTKTPYVITDNSGVIININTNALKLLEKDNKEVIGTIFEPITIILSSTKEQDRLNLAIENNTDYTFDSNLRIANQIVDYRFSISGIQEGTSLYYLIGIEPLQVTNTEAFETYLRDERINRLEKMAGAGFFIFNHDTNETRWSRGLYELLGEEINKVKPTLNFISQIKTNNQELQDIIIAIKEMKPFKTNVAIKSKDNKIHSVNLEISHQEGINNRNVTFGIFSIINMDGLLNNMANEESHNILNDSDFFFLAVIDQKNNLIDINQSFLKYLKLTKDKLLGKSLMNIFKDISYTENNNELILNMKDDKILFKKLKLNNNKGDYFLIIGIPLSHYGKTN